MPYSICKFTVHGDNLSPTPHYCYSLLPHTDIFLILIQHKGAFLARHFHSISSHVIWLVAGGGDKMTCLWKVGYYIWDMDIKSKGT